MRLVVALGGNAVSPSGEVDSIGQQYAHTQQTVAVLADLIQSGHHVAVTHGNGPQIGNALRRVELARTHKVYPLPLDIIGADVQGGMGYMIAQCLTNELSARGDRRSCAALVTMVRVDPGDPAFARPTKPIGSFMTQEDAARRAAADGWIVAEDAGRGWRRLVPSPSPREVVSLPLIRRCFDAGDLLVVCGGGGVPVVRQPDGRLAGVEVVIDKDRTSALLALGLEADTLAIVTSVDQVAIDFGKPTARRIDRTYVQAVRGWLKEGQFPAGSMGPKIEAAVEFVEQAKAESARVLITSIDRLAEALAGRGGTTITRA